MKKTNSVTNQPTNNNKQKNPQTPETNKQQKTHPLPKKNQTQKQANTYFKANKFYLLYSEWKLKIIKVIVLFKMK